jgi:hypothetical protein
MRTMPWAIAGASPRLSRQPAFQQRQDDGRIADDVSVLPGSWLTELQLLTINF